MAITKRKRVLKWIDSIPTVTVARKRRAVRKLLQKGDGNTKLAKSNARSETYKTWGLSLAPADESGVINVCASASVGCKSACLDHQGMAAVWDSIRASRIAKTVLWDQDKGYFLSMLRHELDNIVKQSDREGFKPAIRLNVFSDIMWEKYGIIDDYKSIQWYDYTKHAVRVGEVRPNYWTTFSRSESNQAECLDVLRAGGNVAVAFADTNKPYVGNRAQYQDLPETWEGFPVFDADQDDERWKDPRGGIVVGLRLKAHSHEERADAIDSGFAVCH